MQYTINQLYERLYQMVNNVYDVFKNFFGESNVDLQSSLYEDLLFKKGIEETLRTYGFTIPYDMENAFNIPYDISDEQMGELRNKYSDKKSTIYVHWDKVTVTNEHDKSIEIQDLYAKIGVQMDGRIPYENRGFLLNRATYTKEQFLSNYLHSHIQNIPKSDFTCFMPPCLGRGPINDTIGTLKNEYDEVTWMLFCQELSMYITVESIAGVPWKYLEGIGSTCELSSHSGYTTKGNRDKFIQNFPLEKLKDFIGYYLHNGHLSLSYKNSKFSCGMSYYEYIIDVSNSFIDYYNKYLKKDERQLQECYNNNLLYKVLVKNNKFYKNQQDNANNLNLDNYRDRHVLTFKGRNIRTTIIDTDISEATMTTIIDNDLAMYILHNILKTINFRYINEYNNSREKDPTTAYKRVFYI